MKGIIIQSFHFVKSLLSHQKNSSININPIQPIHKQLRKSLSENKSIKKSNKKNQIQIQTNSKRRQSKLQNQSVKVAPDLQTPKTVQFQNAQNQNHQVQKQQKWKIEEQKNVQKKEQNQYEYKNVIQDQNKKMQIIMEGEKIDKIDRVQRLQRQIQGKLVNKIEDSNNDSKNGKVRKNIFIEGIINKYQQNENMSSNRKQKKQQLIHLIKSEGVKKSQKQFIKNEKSIFNSIKENSNKNKQISIKKNKSNYNEYTMNSVSGKQRLIQNKRRQCVICKKQARSNFETLACTHRIHKECKTQYMQFRMRYRCKACDIKTHINKR